MKNHTFEDWSPRKSNFLNDVITGLKNTQKSIQAKYFYDKKGSEIFDEICDLEEYYPTRTEVSILQKLTKELDSFLKENSSLIEYGSGSSTKIRTILDNSQKVASYTALDISKDHLLEATKEIASNYQNLSINAIHADYMNMNYDYFTRLDNKIVFFPGSTIGNLKEEEAKTLLSNTRKVLTNDGYALIGFDLQKDIEIIKRAYNDKSGVTSRFNKNILERMNEEFEADIDIHLFDHEARYCDRNHRIEMHLVSKVDQKVRLDNEVFSFKKGESICTEYSHKYSLESFEKIASSAGFDTEKYWTDEQNLFAVILLRTR